MAPGITGLQSGTAWSETTATKDEVAARAEALRAAVSVLSGAGVVGPREEERGRRARGSRTRSAEALGRGDATQRAPSRPPRKVSPPLRSALASWLRPSSFRSVPHPRFIPPSNQPRLPAPPTGMAPPTRSAPPPREPERLRVSLPAVSLDLRGRRFGDRGSLSLVGSSVSISAWSSLSGAVRIPR